MKKYRAGKEPSTAHASRNKNKVNLKLRLFFGSRNGELRSVAKRTFISTRTSGPMPPERHKLGKKTGKPLLRPIVPEIKPLMEEAMKLSGF
jgi:hypothetical protein